MPIPDAHIHPTATGKALKTVEAHSKPTDNGDGLIFYAGWFCPFVARTWITLEEKGIPYQYKEENPYHNDKEFLKISPKGLVPAIVWRGKPLHESLVICEFLEEAYPDTPRLMPSDPYDRAQVRLAIDLVSKSIIPVFFKVLQSQEKAAQEKAVNDLTEALKKYGEQAKGPYYMGDQYTFADIALVPWVARFPVIQQHRGFDPSRAGSSFTRWIEAVKSRPSYEAVLSEDQYYEEIYGRYLRDEAQSEAAKATREGKDIP